MGGTELELTVTPGGENLGGETVGGGGKSVPPSHFSDERGNLKFVNIVVRRPCTMCCLVLWVCIFMTIVFSLLISAQGSEIFTESKEYDPFEEKTIKFVSMREAINYCADKREANEVDDATSDQLTLSETGDFTYFIYEAETGKGLLDSAVLTVMHDAEDVIIARDDYPEWCAREYAEDGVGWNCTKPMSLINFYYPSSWDTTLAASVISQLQNGGVDK